MNPIFTHGPSTNLRLLIALTLAIALMVTDHQKDYLTGLRTTLSVVLYPIQAAVDLPRSGGNWLKETFSSRQQLQEENASMRAQNLLLQSRLQKYDSLLAENNRLRELLDSSSKVNENVLIAEILSIDLEPFTRRIVINKGDVEGVFLEQPLLDANGVLGQVVSIGAFSSTAMLITDPSHALPVQSLRTGARAIAIGVATDNQLKLNHIPNNADIKIGDVLVTSGLGGRFPVGYPVGTITDFVIDPSQPFAKVSAKPTADIEHVREVLLVSNAPPTFNFDATIAEQPVEPDTISTESNNSNTDGESSNDEGSEQ
ncbi:MAG: rod shape-determining protein MreC [Gammaproteobacteria bacterium]|nr:rod shape-determining protein MreC [Gammaproteobacteria bacterium]